MPFFLGWQKLRDCPRFFLHEVLTDESGEACALVVGFDEHYVEALFFNELFDPEKKVFRSKEIFSIKIRDSIIGRVINGVGESLDAYGPLLGENMEVFAGAPQIMERQPVTVPLSSGIKVIDTVLPLGRGQRELIVGDRKIGKSSLAVDVVLNQKWADPAVYCVYVLCGQKEQKLRNLVSVLDKRNALIYTSVVAATADSSFAELYLAPFVGCTIAEYFRDRGKDALVVYDDLSMHAKAYRNIALLLERPPGREAYPGDIFSLHAGLLERAAKLGVEQGGGSLTALPIVETQEGDITAFISTNLVSITDGQIYFERGLFQKGFLPAVNVGLSVSRVGSKAQPEALKKVTGALRLALAQHKELQKLARLETTKSKEATKKIQRGELLLELLKQDKHVNVTWQEQVVLFSIVEQGHFDDLERSLWHDFERLLLELIRNQYFDLLEDIKEKGLTESHETQIEEIVLDFKRQFVI